MKYLNSYLKDRIVSNLKWSKHKIGYINIYLNILAFLRYNFSIMSEKHFNYKIYDPLNLDSVPSNNPARCSQAAK